MNWTEVQLAYLAGIIDGEGTFYIYVGKNGRKFNSRIYVVNTNEEIINWLKATFGGLVYSRTSPKNPLWKRKFEWILDKKAQDIVCVKILPYLIIKKKHAEVMIEFRKSFTQQSYQHISEETLAFRFACHKKIKTLNHETSISV